MGMANTAFLPQQNPQFGGYVPHSALLAATLQRGAPPVHSIGQGVVNVGEKMFLAAMERKAREEAEAKDRQDSEFISRALSNSFSDLSNPNLQQAPDGRVYDPNRAQDPALAGVQGTPMTDQQRLGFVMSNLASDPRTLGQAGNMPGLADALMGKPAEPLQINNQLIDPNTREVLADFRTPQRPVAVADANSPTGSTLVDPADAAGQPAPPPNSEVADQIAMMRLELDRAREEREVAQIETQSERDRSQAGYNARNTLEQIQSTIDLTARIQENPNLEALTGSTDSLGEMMDLVLPNMKGRTKEAASDLKTLTSQLALRTMETLKAQSATGATGFGALSESELDVLQTALTNLEREDLSDEAMMSNLDDVLAINQKARANLLLKYQQDFGEDFYSTPFGRGLAPLSNGGNFMTTQQTIDLTGG